jgi:XapX domain-containing protein
MSEPNAVAMDVTLTALALLTGLVTGALFTFLGIPMPAPPELPGVMGIVGIYVGYKLVEALDVGVDLLALLGLAG